MDRVRVIIMGAAGRDFHNFNVRFRNNDHYQVVAFTATQIPDIEGRVYPPTLAGPGYVDGIPIYPESKLDELIRELGADLVVFAYSDVSHIHVMHKASQVIAAGADYLLMGAKHTMLASSKPVIAVCAVRTGAGKSQTTRRVCDHLRALHRQVVVVRHPMPYGDLARQACQRFATLADLDRNNCTIEEREEYEPHLARGIVVYAGVDYERILGQAEREAEVIVWDGGNNDLPFFRPDLHIVVADPHRAGDELLYHPGEANLRMADIVIVNKVDTAHAKEIQQVQRNAVEVNPTATVIQAASPVSVGDPAGVRDRRVLVVEDGPTLTHGEMAYGAGIVAARQFGAAEVIDPRPYAVGSINDTYAKYPQIGSLLPAMGYDAQQIQDLEATINATPCDLVLVATPVDLRHLVDIRHPTQRVTYELCEIGRPTLEEIVKDFVRDQFHPESRTTNRG
jgi:predicted GTPase